VAAAASHAMLWVPSVPAACAALAGRAVGGPAAAATALAAVMGTAVAAAAAAAAGAAAAAPAAATALAAMMGTAVCGVAAGDAAGAAAVRPLLGDSCTAGYARQPALHSAIHGTLWTTTVIHPAGHWQNFPDLPGWPRVTFSWALVLKCVLVGLVGDVTSRGKVHPYLAAFEFEANTHVLTKSARRSMICYFGASYGNRLKIGERLTPSSTRSF
jgi:hypothetical protein